MSTRKTSTMSHLYWGQRNKRRKCQFTKKKKKDKMERQMENTKQKGCKCT